MKPSKQLIIWMLPVFMLAMVRCSSDKTPTLGKDPVKKVVAAMTLEEKAYFVTGTGMNFPGFGSQGDTALTPGAPVIGETQKLVPGAAGTTYEIPRLGIPAMVLADGPAGLRIMPKREGDSATYYCTAFPVATLLASSWDTELVNKVGQAMGNDVLEYGADVLLGPALNIHRNPLCGRNFEYYSEDPLVSGKMAAAMVNGIESQGVGTSVKHFAANNAETNRMALNTIVSERALREIYLEGFRIVVEEAQPWTVMSSYNLINGTMTSESGDLLTKVLRDDWGFKGYVMTDWFGGTDPVAQMTAGNDLLMPGTTQQAKAIYNAVKEGKLDEKVLDRNIERILNIMLETPRFKGYQYSNKPDLKAHAAVVREAATEGMVLLKNDQAALPLDKGLKLATFGTATFETVIGGTGSGDVNEAYIVSIADGLKQAGYACDASLEKTYLDYIQKTRESMGKPKNPLMAMMGVKEPVPDMPVNAALAGRMAAANDVAVITVGRNSGEGGDRVVDNDFNLSETEKDNIAAITNAFHAKGKKVVVLLNVGGVVETASWKEHPDAILLVWQAGQETGNALADVVSGKVNPSGKLATTFPVKYEDGPSVKDFPGIVTDTAKPAQGEADDIMSFMRPKASRIVYEEGIYVGYRYFETFGVKPSYEFGYGLSYTTFEYNNIKVGPAQFKDKVTVTVDVKNTGKVAGREVVQLYLGAPAVKLDKPVVELKGFAKTRLLQPGEVETLSFELTARQLASFDAAASAWVAEAGDYTVKVGASSRDIRQEGTFSVGKEITVKKESKALAPVEAITELKPGR